MNFTELLTRHALASYDKQLYLQAMHGRHRWELRLDEATLTFSGPHNASETYKVQFIGTASDTAKTWRWAWANEGTFPNAGSLESARELQQQGAPELAEAEQPLPTPAEAFALVASGVCRAGAYFRAAYPDGALFMLIRDLRFKRVVQRPLTRIARVLPMFLSDFSLPDVQTAFEQYLHFYKFEPQPQALADGTRYSLAPRPGHDPMQVESQSLVAEFDATRRLRRIGLDGN
jgi:hypothetical protein